MPPKATKKRGRRTTSQKAGLAFPVGKFARKLREGKVTKRLSPSAVVALTAVLQSVTTELLLNSARVAAVNKKRTVKPRHIKLGICEDEDFSKLLANVTIAKGGVAPTVTK